MNASPESLTSESPPQSVLVPYAEDPLAVLVDLVLDRHAGTLPDLTGAVILIPDMQAAARLRRLLLRGVQQRGHGALLGPFIGTPRHWARRSHPLRKRLLNDPARELMLVEALSDHPSLLRNNSPWALAENLLALFDELTLQQSVLPDDADGFVRQLRSAYGMKENTCRALSDEARLVHTLWRAYYRQLAGQQSCDEHIAYAEALSFPTDAGQAGAATAPDQQRIYLAGFERFCRAEQHWIRRLLGQRRLTLVVHGTCTAGTDSDLCHPDGAVHAIYRDLNIEAPPTPAPADHYTALLDHVFAPLPDAGRDEAVPDFERRARGFAQAYPASPAADRLFVCAARDAEHEAQAVDLQVRRWLLAGRRHIGIVTEDRRLARRVRALLERANVTLRDAAGWALSTTSAGAAVERWLETVEEDFAHVPLLDLLKSAFVLPDWEQERLKTATFRLEQDIVHYESVGRNLQRYRRHLHYRRERLAWQDRSLDELLDALERAAAPLLPLTGARRHAPEKLLDALHASLHRLGMDRQLEQDPAGTQILEQLTAMRTAADGRNLRIDWREFRGWLGRRLERAYFRPQTGTDDVQLLSLEQSRLCRFDALIIAGADYEHLPGGGDASPFFNDAVRRELGLASGRDRLQSRFHHFRRLLEAAPAVLITRCRERNGEAVPPSPWVEALESFHRLAYRAPLHDDGITALAGRPETTVASSELPAIRQPQRMPAPALAPALVPAAISATSYQQLVNCPYQFFAISGLQLRAPEYLREMLEKDEYGSKVHRILEAFHGGCPGLPGPFTEPLSAANRAAALALLEQISRREFAANVEDNFLHRGWLKRWLDIAPAYIDWQIERAKSWRVADTERSRRGKTLPDGTQVTGRLDRVDRNDNGLAIVDYKTGAVPGAADVACGEAVQLPFYALLTETPPVRAEYVVLAKDGVKSSAALEGDALDALAQRNTQRLIDALRAIRTGTPLTAWGDHTVCRYCAADGVCRRQAWADTVDFAALADVAGTNGDSR